MFVGLTDHPLIFRWHYSFGHGRKNNNGFRPLRKGLKLLTPVTPVTPDRFNPSQNFEREKKEEVIGRSGVAGVSGVKSLEDFGKTLN